MAQRTPEERFWSKVDKNGPFPALFWDHDQGQLVPPPAAVGRCWIWRGSVDKKGYGRASRDRAHRETYRAIIGPIPQGHQLDHLCRVPICVNPAHLEPVLPKENTFRGVNGNRSQCKNGHHYTADNTRLRLRRGRVSRVCMACRRMGPSRRSVTPEKAIEAQALFDLGTMTQAEIAKQLGLGQSTVSLLVRGLYHYTTGDVVTESNPRRRDA